MPTKFVVETMADDWTEYKALPSTSDLTKHAIANLAHRASVETGRQARVRKVVEKIVFMTSKPT